MSTIEDLKKRLKDNDEEIADLKGWIKDYDLKIRKGEDLKPAQEKQLADWRTRLKDLTDHNRELTQQITELSKSRPGDEHAISALSEKIDRMELAQRLQKATSTTTRVEVYTNFESKGLISNFKPENHLNQFHGFKTNMWTSALKDSRGKREVQVTQPKFLHIWETNDGRYPFKIKQGSIEALGTRILDNQVFDPDDAEIPENIKALGEIKSPGKEESKLSNEDKGQLMDYLTRLLIAQPLRTFIRGFLTNLDYVILMEGRRNPEKPGGVEIFISAEMHYIHDKGAMWLAAMAALSAEHSGVVRIPEVQEYTREKLLGSGKTSAVYQLKKANDLFAFKVVRGEFRAECLLNEVNMLKKCKGTSIPEIVMELPEGFVMKPVLSSISGSLFRDHVEQLFQALSHVHAQGIVCRDIRPENILVSLEGRAFLTDFGFAQKIYNANGETGEQEPNLTVYQGTMSTASNRILESLKNDRKAPIQVAPIDDFESLAKSFYLIATNQRVRAIDAAGVLNYWQNPKIPEYWRQAFERTRDRKIDEAKTLLFNLC